MNKKQASFIIGVYLGTLLSGCTQIRTTETMEHIDLQGHRGARGLMPENTIPAFMKALELGVTTLELDVAVSKDGKVLVSHEPWLSHEICLQKDGSPISEAEEKGYNLHQMPYAEIQQYDCGSKPHPRFPEQEKMVVHKPLLSDVIDSAEAYIQQHGLAPVHYNIEIKSMPEGDGLFHPAPEAFVDLVMQVLNEKGIAARSNLQSFDVRPLQIAHVKYPQMALALLVENEEGYKKNIARLGFTPPIYSPDYKLVDEALMNWARKEGIKVIPWTVNDPGDAQKLIEMGVHGIITDYPDRVRTTP
jgi:glycerophosphoryl diester phosphodiesterase